ncbi:MAG TPA: aminotransferase class I/II-fold pyridoxal phosphate-dependent enzyme, partial [bacterium]|nr:aminotransferase class I/II-fold pyridoxal phosphate-dependent enzyme [bacterium]
MAEVEENWQDFYSASARVMTRSLIRELLKLTRRGNIISFAGGLPDPATFPVEEIKAITAGLLEREANLVLQYGPTEGDARLRDELVKWMAKDGIHVSRDQVLVTLGSQQGLDLVGRVFLDPGDLVIVELPSYMAALQ